MKARIHLAAPLIPLCLYSCGIDESGPNRPTLNDAPSEGPMTTIVDGHDELPPCSEENDGALVVVLDGSRLFVCTEGSFEELSTSGNDGANGNDGQNGVDGTDGEDGSDGEDGVDGKDGEDGTDGEDGVDGRDGEQGRAGEDATEIVVDDVAPGDSCPYGGKRVSGSDWETYLCDAMPDLLEGRDIDTLLPNVVFCDGATDNVGGAGGAGATGCVTWLGSYFRPPENPSENDAFFYQGAGTACVFDGKAWQVLAQAEPHRLGGCSPYTRIFTASGTFSPDFGGVVFADAICQEQADDAGVGGTWRAWISDSLGNSPSENFAHQAYAYRSVDGNLVASDWEDLTDGALLSHIAAQLDGGSNFGTTATGTNNDGTPANNTCRDWTTSAPSDRATVGLSAQFDDRWSAWTTDNCSRSFRLYCFEM